MKLAILTQIADPNDPNLGVFFRWFCLLSKHFEKTAVVALSVGGADEPPGEARGISFFSAGKERGRGRTLRRIFFFFHAVRAAFQSDIILVHMIPEYALAVGWVARLLGKRVYLWYAHGAVTWKLKLAHRIVDGVLSSSPEGFRLSSDKVVFVGQGIDTDLFHPEGIKKSSGRLKLVTVGRISPAKHLDIMLQALKTLKQKGTPFHFSIVGGPITTKDLEYQEALKRLTREYSLEAEVSFMGPVPPLKVAEVLRDHDLFLNLSGTGSLDKAVLEAMSAGLSVITANPAYRRILSERYLMNERSAALLAERIAILAAEPRPASRLREIVVRDHNLEKTIKKIAATLHGPPVKRKFIYISPLRYPSERVGSFFSMKSCEAFAEQGFDVELWVPRRRNPKLAKADPFLFHKVKRNFRIVYLPALDLPVSWFYFPMAASFGISVAVYAMIRGLYYAIFYSHEELGLFLLTFLRRKTVYEIHDFPAKSPIDRPMLRRVWRIISTNDWKRDELVSRFGVRPQKIYVVPNAVAVEEFNSALTKAEARRLFDLPASAFIALYTGSLQGWKGVDTLIEAAASLPEALVYIVGGGDGDIERLRIKHPAASQALSRLGEAGEAPAGARLARLGRRPAGRQESRIKNVIFTGWRPHAEIPQWLRAADVLVLPNTAKEEISKYYTSPVKLFEYMASETPVVASNLPSVRQVADETSVTFFEPDNPADLAAKIKSIAENPESALAKAEKAKEAVKRYTWQARAEAIWAFILPRET